MVQITNIAHHTNGGLPGKRKNEILFFLFSTKTRKQKKNQTTSGPVMTPSYESFLHLPVCITNANCIFKNILHRFGGVCWYSTI